MLDQKDGRLRREFKRDLHVQRAENYTWQVFAAIKRGFRVSVPCQKKNDKETKLTSQGNAIYQTEELTVGVMCV